MRKPMIHSCGLGSVRGCCRSTMYKYSSALDEGPFCCAPFYGHQTGEKFCTDSTGLPRCFRVKLALSPLNKQPSPFGGMRSKLWRRIHPRAGSLFFERPRGPIGPEFDVRAAALEQRNVPFCFHFSSGRAFDILGNNVPAFLDALGSAISNS